MFFKKYKKKIAQLEQENKDVIAKNRELINDLWVAHDAAEDRHNHCGEMEEKIDDLIAENLELSANMTKLTNENKRIRATEEELTRRIRELTQAIESCRALETNTSIAINTTQGVAHHLNDLATSLADSIKKIEELNSKPQVTAPKRLVSPKAPKKEEGAKTSRKGFK